MCYVLCCSVFTASFTCGFLPQWIAKSIDGSVVLWTAECGGRPSAPRHTTIPQSSSLVLDQMPCTTCTMARLKLQNIWNNFWHVILALKDMPLILWKLSYIQFPNTWFVNLEWYPPGRIFRDCHQSVLESSVISSVQRWPMHPHKGRIPITCCSKLNCNTQEGFQCSKNDIILMTRVPF